VGSVPMNSLSEGMSVAAGGGAESNIVPTVKGHNYPNDSLSFPCFRTLSLTISSPSSSLFLAASFAASLVGGANGTLI
jgi:hypothetical protein